MRLDANGAWRDGARRGRLEATLTALKRFKQPLNVDFDYEVVEIGGVDEDSVTATPRINASDGVEPEQIEDIKAAS